MTDLRQAAQQALEALIDAANVLSAPMFADAADALRTALEQPEQRPWVDLTDDDRFEIAAAQHGWEDLLIAAEAKLKELNT